MQSKPSAPRARGQTRVRHGVSTGATHARGEQSSWRHPGQHPPLKETAMSSPDTHAPAASHLTLARPLPDAGSSSAIEPVRRIAGSRTADASLAARLATAPGLVRRRRRALGRRPDADPSALAGERVRRPGAAARPRRPRRALRPRPRRRRRRRRRDRRRAAGRGGVAGRRAAVRLRPQARLPRPRDRRAAGPRRRRRRPARAARRRRDLQRRVRRALHRRPGGVGRRGRRRVRPRRHARRRRHA